MSFNAKIHADCVELVNQYLDTIPIENEQDFKHIKEALKTLIEFYPIPELTDSLKGRIENIQYLLDFPNMYVQDRANDEEFKKIVLARVANKIKEFEEFSPEDKKIILMLRNKKNFKKLNIKNSYLIVNHLRQAQKLMFYLMKNGFKNKAILFKA